MHKPKNTTEHTKDEKTSKEEQWRNNEVKFLIPHRVWHWPPISYTRFAQGPPSPSPRQAVDLPYLS